MSTTTQNLELFKYDTTDDANMAFNIDTALNNNWDKIDNLVGNYVLKSGDTMTGDLTLSKETPQLFLNNTDLSSSYCEIWTQTSTLDYASTTAPDANQGSFRIIGKDKNGNYIGGISQLLNTNNNLYTQIYTARSISNTVKTGSIRIGINGNGVIYSYCDASDVVHSIVTTEGISKAITGEGGKGYIKFGNGIILQWGSMAVTSSKEYTVKYPISFTGTYTYSIVKNYASNGSNSCSDRESSFYSRSLSQATTYCNKDDTDGFSWLAIGY